MTKASVKSKEAKKWVYLFNEGSKDMRDLLGGKGAGVAEMTNLGLPVPPGFTITTEACNEYFRLGHQFPEGMWEQVLAALSTIEKQVGKKFGDPQNPLLVSVRSGAKMSMPGMMDTVLNVGLNNKTLHGLAKLTGDERFAYDAYRRLIQMFGRIVKSIDGRKFENILESYKEKTEGKKDTDLTVDMLKEIVREYKALYKEELGEDFPEEPIEQLRQAIEAVFASWFGKRAVDYRNFHKIAHDLGTAANVQMMVFGNMGFDSGTGVAFTRSPSTGEKALFGEYLLNAQGEDVVAGVRTPNKISELEKEMPKIYTQLAQISERLEEHYRDMQDMEFTIERGKLWMLQTRTGKRTASAALKIAVDMVKEGLISKEEAVMRVSPEQVDQLLHPVFDEKAKAEARQSGRYLAKGLNASPGAASGIAIFDATRAQEAAQVEMEVEEDGQKKKIKQPVILVRPETSPEDVHGMLAAQGILTQRGGATSHAAVVARGLNKPCVAGCEALSIDVDKRQFAVNDKVVNEGDYISIDGTTGEVFLGKIPAVEVKYEEQTDLIQLLSWADEFRRLEVWANADYPRDAAQARKFGAQGIGLCRTEHMFFEEGRLPIVQQMILLSGKATAIENRIQALRKELENASGTLAQSLQAEIAELEEQPERKQYYEALDQLLPLQRGDFEGIFQVMDGLPVIIRLIDPPMHEFLPKREKLIQEVTELRCRGDNPALLQEKERLLKIVEDMHEANPMLGLRGCRLGIMFPGVTEMQVRAIFQAACRMSKKGVKVLPRVMIPLVSHVNELRHEQVALEKVAQQVMQEEGVEIDYKFGTMIEIARAALTADEIAELAQFFSFGTNDLTQTTYGISRDDAEKGFLLAYVDRKILPANPFQVLDREGVGKLMKMAVELGRKTRPGMSIGICGEHGGDPSSIEFCHMTGLDYVSASPYRVPIARLAAAQAALGQKHEQDK
ncbi:MAG: pyruvate, phosphate dikinase [Anaerolineae bacterium]